MTSSWPASSRRRPRSRRCSTATGGSELRAQGKRAFSHDAIRAALLIQLYRDQPALHLPFRLLVALVDLDTGMTAFRQAHARMVRRAIGARVGTGGTSGHAYLEAATAEAHRVR